MLADEKFAPMTDQFVDDKIGIGERAIGDLSRRVIHAEEALKEIRLELRSLNLSLQNLNVSIANMGKPQYQTWAVFGTLFCTITAGVWWLAISPISEKVKALEASSSTITPREVHMEKWAQVDKEIQRLQNEIDGRATKDDLNRLIIDLDRRLSKPRER